MEKRETNTVEILHRDSSFTYKHDNVISVHEEGRYTVLYKLDGTVYKFPTDTIFRLKIYKKADK